MYICTVEGASVTSSRSAGPLAWLPELTGTRCPDRQEKIDIYFIIASKVELQHCGMA